MASLNCLSTSTLSDQSLVNHYIWFNRNIFFWKKADFCLTFINLGINKVIKDGTDACPSSIVTLSSDFLSSNFYQFPEDGWYCHGVQDEGQLVSIKPWRCLRRQTVSSFSPGINILDNFISESNIRFWHQMWLYRPTTSEDDHMAVVGFHGKVIIWYSLLSSLNVPSVEIPFLNYGRSLLSIFNNGLQQVEVSVLRPVDIYMLAFGQFFTDPYLRTCGQRFFYYVWPEGVLIGSDRYTLTIVGWVTKEIK